VVDVASAAAGVRRNGRQLAESIQLNATVGAAEDYPRDSICRLRRLGICLGLLRAGGRPESDRTPLRRLKRVSPVRLKQLQLLKLKTKYQYNNKSLSKKEGYLNKRRSIQFQLNFKMKMVLMT
jgi:hypothetical protein